MLTNLAKLSQPLLAGLQPLRKTAGELVFLENTLQTHGKKLADMMQGGIRNANPSEVIFSSTKVSLAIAGNSCRAASLYVAGGKAVEYAKKQGGEAVEYAKKQGGEAAEYAKKQGGEAAEYTKKQFLDPLSSAMRKPVNTDLTEVLLLAALS